MMESTLAALAIVPGKTIAWISLFQFENGGSSVVHENVSYPAELERVLNDYTPPRTMCQAIVVEDVVPGLRDVILRAKQVGMIMEWCRSSGKGKCGHLVLQSPATARPYIKRADRQVISPKEWPHPVGRSPIFYDHRDAVVRARAHLLAWFSKERRRQRSQAA